MTVFFQYTYDTNEETESYLWDRSGLRLHRASAAELRLEWFFPQNSARIPFPLRMEVKIPSPFPSTIYLIYSSVILSLSLATPTTAAHMLFPVHNRHEPNLVWKGLSA